MVRRSNELFQISPTDFPDFKGSTFDGQPLTGYGNDPPSVLRSGWFLWLFGGRCVPWFRQFLRELHQGLHGLLTFFVGRTQRFCDSPIDKGNTVILVADLPKEAFDITGLHGFR